MRKGINPNKDKGTLLSNYSSHRIISAIHVPHTNDYFKDALKITDLFLSSLTASISENSKITIIDNASCLELKQLLNQYCQNGKIDRLIINNKNIGKIDAMMHALRGSHEALITLTDADILFKPGWKEETIKIFDAFSDAGAVSPLPLRGSSSYYTVSVMEQIVNGYLNLRQMQIPENHDNHNLYLKSIGWPPESELKNWNIVSQNNLSAIMGAGHAVITIKRDPIIQFAPKYESKALLGKNSENNYIDIPIDRARLLRLSTYNYWAYHMGNVFEEWMLERSKNYSNLKIQEPEIDERIIRLSKKSYAKSNFIGSFFIYRIRKKLMKVLINRKISKIN